MTWWPRQPAVRLAGQPVRGQARSEMGVRLTAPWICLGFRDEADLPAGIDLMLAKAVVLLPVDQVHQPCQGLN